MDERRLACAIESLVGKTLARDIAADFVKLRSDVTTGTLERASAGKFVESFAQCLKNISSGQNGGAPGIDDYLKNRVENDTSLPDGLRLCGSRIARSIYTMRNKRNIAHKGEISPNRMDLEFTHHGATWIMAELIRCATGTTMEEAGSLIKLVHTPVGTLVEEIDGVRIVHANVPVRLEILVLLHSLHPDRATSAELVGWVGKSPGATRSRLRELHKERLIVGNGSKGYRLTSTGYTEATEMIRRQQTLDDATC